MYPLFVLTTIGAALIFWLVYVMPKLLAVITQMGVPMPLATRLMLVASNMVRSYWYILPFAIGALLVAIKAARKKEMVRYYYDMVKMRLPIIKLFVINKHLASFAEQMKIMVVAGITIDRALTVASDSVGSEVLKRALVRVKERILSGSRISEAIRENGVFPKMVVRLIDVGESSGNLSDQFAFLSDYYTEKLNDVSEKLGKMIEPLMMAVVGGIFALMMTAILLPIYEVVGKFK